MRLEKLTLQGFKSFADPVSFDFTKNFTAIVGPNGSGKSNVSDAIRWVLGEQSVKLLRGKQAQDLIFSGSDKLSKLGMAQVELHLDNADGTFPLEYPEIVISRKIFRSGESEYRINNSTVRLQDIVMMLAQAKFGQKSYAVIGQGMITNFLNASPQERKLFFDEATGVREFQIKRDQAIHTLIRTEDNLVQSEALLTEIEPHLHSLERLVKRLEKREKVEAELKEVQVQYYGSIWHEQKKEYFVLQQQFANQAAEIEEIEDELEKEQTASDALTSEASRAERYEELQKKYNAILEQKNSILKEQAILKGKLEVEHERQGELSLVWMERKEDELLKDIHSREGEHALLLQQIEREENELKRKEHNFTALQDEFRNEEYSIVQLKQQIETESHAFTVPEIKVRLEEIFDAQEEFLLKLMGTNTLDEFHAVQHAGKKVTERFAEFMDELNDDEKTTEKTTIEALKIEMKRKEQGLERLMKERATVQKSVNELRVNIASQQNKGHFAHEQLLRLQNELSAIQSDIDEAEKEKTDAGKNQQASLYNQQLKKYEEEAQRFDNQLQDVRTQIDSFNTEEEEKKTQLVALQSQMRTLQRKLNNLRQNANTIEVNLARIETRQEDLIDELKREVDLALHKSIFAYEPGSDTLSKHTIEKRMVSLQRQLAAIGEVDDETVKEHAETKERFDFLTEQTTDLHNAILSLEKVIDELDATIHVQFQKNFKKINDGFQKYFQVLFDGGKAKLELLTEEKAEEDAALEDGVESSEIVTENLESERMRELIGKKKKNQKIIAGIDVMASPPGKKVNNITALSGGEKSLVAIALLCSIIAHNPSPFVFLDEVEAALDEENSERLAAILKKLAQKTQIIVITHNRVSMRAADILYGVTMGKEGKSHILSVELKEAEEMVEEA